MLAAGVCTQRLTGGERGDKGTGIIPFPEVETISKLSSPPHFVCTPYDTAATLSLPLFTSWDGDSEYSPQDCRGAEFPS